MNYTAIETESSNRIATIWLNRPEVHNAFNETMIAEITHAVNELGKEPAIRLVVLRGRGKSFCAGADLNWMKAVANYTREENYQESLRLSDCFYAIYTCPKPVISIVHGAAIGGANGLIAASDIAYCEDETIFSLSEVKIGLVPAVISPYVIKRIGEMDARELMLTGKRIQGKEAERLRLVNRSFPAFDLEENLKQFVSLILSSGPQAVSICKQLIHDVSNTHTMEESRTETAKIIADIRASAEGQEGMAAFLEKRTPAWLKNEEGT